MGEQASAGGEGGALTSARLGAGRTVAAISLVGIAAYAAVIALGEQSGADFQALRPWSLGGVALAGSTAFASVLLALALGWAVPGVSIAMLFGGRADLVRSFVCGTAYVSISTLLFGFVAGGAPSRATLLVLLALPSIALLARGSSLGIPWREWLGAGIAIAVLSIVLWPKLAHEGLNGDGTEAYELGLSLSHHRLPRWDLERWEPPGRFGTPAVNPFLINSLLVRSTMTLVGEGELSVRLFLVPGLVIAAIAAGRLAGAAGWTGGGYLLSVSLLYLLWNSYYVGYEPAFTDLGEPAATDTLMVALLMAGAVELGRRSVGFATIAFVLAAGILYSAPLLAGVALSFLCVLDRPLGRRALRSWTGAIVCCVLLGLAIGAVTGDLADWTRQVRAEYVDDFVGRGAPRQGLPLLGLALLATGGLPLVLAKRWRSVPPVPAAFFLTASVYVAIVFASAEKNLHYLAPVPFLIAPAAILASTDRERVAASLVAATTLVLSWPDDVRIHRETIEMGREACVTGLDYETAVLGAEVVYEAFGRPARDELFHIGKHTFVRYAMALEGDCRIVLSGAAAATQAADGTLALTFDDPSVLDRWRSRRMPIPRSLLFPRLDVAAE